MNMYQYVFFNDTVKPFLGFSTGKCTISQNNALLSKQFLEAELPNYGNYTQIEMYYEWYNKICIYIRI